MMSGRGAKLLAIVLDEKNKAELKNKAASTIANINNLVPLVTYNFNVAENNDHPVDDVPKLKAEHSPLHLLPINPCRTSPLLLIANETDLVLHDDNIDIMLLPELETEIYSHPDNLPKKYLHIAPLSDYNKTINNNPPDTNLHTDTIEYDSNQSNLNDPDYVPLPDESNNFNNTQITICDTDNNLQIYQTKCFDTSDDNDPDYLLLQDADENDTEIIPLKKRRKVANKNCWDKFVNQKKRMNGKEYVGYTRKGKIVKHNIKRNQRQIGPKCESTFCKRASNRHCNLFSDEIRQAIFEKFWAMDWEQKRLFIVHMVNYSEKDRSYVITPSRRSGSFQYYLKRETGKFQVCKITFLATLGIKEKMVINWVNEGKKFGLLDSKERRNEKTTEKKRTSKLVMGTQERRLHLNRFFDQMPKMESHYCRANTYKLYLEEDFKSKREVYKFYTEKCLADSVTPLSSFSFCREMDDKNIGLFKPRKDQCDLCYAYKNKQLEECDYKIHLEAKEEARNEKEIDKKEAQEDLIYCFTMDVQAVKLCPKLEVSTAYYKTKLQVHNFTLYNLKTHQSKNFVWNESEGELCSSVFATCIVKHLESLLSIEIRPIVLWSDSCGYQNKNNILSNALSLLATKCNVTIEQKYLEKGHTQMECHSTHSLIERRLKGKDIFLPTDYINIIKDARKKPFPLDVEYLDHTYFLNFEDPNIKRYNSIRPGNKTNDLKVNNLRCLKYEPNGEVFYKCTFKDTYVLLPQRQKEVDINYVPKTLYTERLKIKKAKWTHLQQFKSVLPKDVHFFYDALEYYEKPNNVDEDKDEHSEKSKGECSIGKRSTKNCAQSVNNVNTMDQAKRFKRNSKTAPNQESKKNNKKAPKERTKLKKKINEKQFSIGVSAV